MKRLWVQLSLAFLLVAWVSIAALAFVVQQSTGIIFRHYVMERDMMGMSADLIEELEHYYAANGSWEGANSLLTTHNTMGNGMMGGGAGGGAGRRGQESLLADMNGTVIASTDAAQTGITLSADELNAAVGLYVDGRQVGWLYRQTATTEALGAAEETFLNEASRLLQMAALAASVLALVVGITLAWLLTRPLGRLTQAAHALSQGQLGQQVPVSGTQEVQEVAVAFNHMSAALEKSEALRQRMAADVAHELRTPVTVLRGHLEAMLDGMYPLDSEHVAVAHDQTLYLSRLVEDLRLLTLAEARQLPLEKTRHAPAEIVRQVVDAFEPLALDADVRLTEQVADKLPALDVDITRIRQVLGNLLTNGLRHTPAGGEIALTVSCPNKAVQFSVANTGRPLSADEAAQVFQPFWRAEQARERDKGGSGLGLAISQQLITLHGGRMWTEANANHTTFTFELPCP